MSYEDLPELARFCGTVRRPRPLKDGLMAQIFATNGVDADQVVPLGMSGIQDSRVVVTCAFSADKYIAFQAALRRPDSLESGVVARFFAENGDDADAVNELGRSEYSEQECAVSVRQVQNPDGSPVKAKAEKPEKGPHRHQAAVLWKSSFLRNPEVWPHLGSDEEYLVWVRSQPCCASGVHHGDVVAAHVRRIADGAGTGIKPPYAAVPLCDKHHQLQHQYGESAVGEKEWFDRQRIKHVQTWAWVWLTEAMGEQSMTFVEPSRVAAWADSRGILRLLPLDYAVELSAMKEQERT